MTQRLSPVSFLASNKGLSLTEVLIGTGIMGIMFMIIMTMMVEEFRQSARFEQASEGWVGGTVASTHLSTDFRNILRLEPGEPLLRGGGTAQSKLYRGFENLRTDEAPAECLASADFHAFRSTAALRGVRTERIYRKYNEIMTDADLPENELRMTLTTDPADPNGISAFALPEPPREVYIVDAGGYYFRRYRVVSFENRIDVDRDPADDEKKNDADGNPIKFTYTAVKLAMPNDRAGTRHNSVVRVGFLTDSVVYMTDTSVTCIDRNNNELAQFSESGNLRQTVFVAAEKDLKLTKFTVLMKIARPGRRYEDWYFSRDLRSIDPVTYPPLCVDHVEYTMVFSKTELEQNKEMVTMRRPIHLANFTPGKTAECP